MESLQAFCDLRFEEENLYDSKLNDENYLFSLLSDKLDIKKIGKVIGSGSEGVIYHYGDDKILKINLDPRVTKDSFLEICDYIKNNENNHIMKIYDYGMIYKDQVFWYLGEKLEPLKEYERVELEYNSDAYHNFVTREMAFKIYKTKTKRINDLWKFLSGFTYRHIDLWYANVMRDKDLNIKVIDVEGFGEQCQ
jgi:hypothetical protein